VARKKPHRTTVSSAADLRARAQRAAREGRTQQALELAKQLHKHEPTPAHLELLKSAYLARARQLRAQGHGRDAVTVLEAARRIDATPAYREELALELAAAGAVRQALELVPPSSESPAAGRVLARAADAALEQGATARELLPPALHADFDRVLLAFDHLAAGREEARAALQPLGLRSPFLEWKLLLRGLQAYYRNEDVRALENWQRLDAERLPARLAAPYRAQIDPAFRHAQPPETQAALQKQLDRLQGSPLQAQLRSLRAALADRASLAPAFRQAEALLPALRQAAPELVPRLARCLYWEATDADPEDVLRYQRVFGAPADDPHLHRLRALAAEREGALDEAHRHWQQYEQRLAANPSAWPAVQAARARSLVWLRMGHNADRIPGPDKLRALPGALRAAAGRLPQLSPPAEECFRRAAELAPDQIEPLEAFFEHLRDAGQSARAEKAGRELLRRFPGHVPTLEALGELCLERKKYGPGLELLQQALKGNPLDRTLKEKVLTAHLHHARAEVEAGHFDAARQDYQAALALQGAGGPTWVLARWAACEFKAGDEGRAEELLTQARAAGGPPLALAYAMLTETIRLKLGPKLKARFDGDFKAGLAEAPSAPAAADLLRMTTALERAGVTYHGQKTHRQKVLAYLEKARREAEFTEPQLEDVCRALLALEARKQARTFAALAKKKFKANPWFPFFEAVTYFLEGPTQCPYYPTRTLLEQAERLAQALPPDERRDRLLEDIRARQTALEAFSPFGGFMQDFFETPFGDEWDEDEDDWDD
jgi:tetratricopeptide (TPR) repeat protein